MHLFKKPILLLLVCVCFPSSLWAEGWELRRKDRWQQIATRWKRLFLSDPRREDVAQRLFTHYAKRGYSTRLIQEIQQSPAKGAALDRKTLALAHLYHRKGAYRRAFASYQRLWNKREKLQRWLSSAQLALWMGRTLLAQRRGDEAIKLWQAALDTKPTKALQVKLLEGMGAQALQQQRPVQALAVYQKLAVLLPKDPTKKIALARILRQLQRYKEAREMLQLAVQKSPASRRPMLWKLIAEDALLARDPKTAIQSITSAQKRLGPQHWLHRELDLLMIRAHRQQGTIAALIAMYEKLVSRSPQRIRPLLAQLYEETQQFDKAILLYQKMVGRNYKSPMFSTLASLLAQHGHRKKALQLMLDRHRRYPKDDQIALQTLDFLHAIEEPSFSSQLQNMLLTPLGKHPRFLESLLQRASSWKLLPQQELSFFEKLCAIPPLRASCFSRWGKLLWKQRRKAEAWAVWRRIESFSSPSASDLFTLSTLLHRHERGTDSIPILKRVISLAPKHQKARLLLAQELLKAGDPTREAGALFRHVCLESSSASLREAAQKGVVRVAVLHHGKEGAWFLFSRQAILNPFSLFDRKIMIMYAREVQQRMEALQSLQVALAMAPEDLDLHRLALLLYGQSPKALHHLRELIRLDRLHFMRYLPDLLQLAKLHHQQQMSLSLLQSLVQQKPEDTKLWRWLGQEASQQKNWSLAAKAFQEALQREPKDTDSRVGLARLHVRTAHWQEAYDILSTGPFPAKDSEVWQSLLLQSGQKLRVAPKRLMQALQRSLKPHPYPDLALMRLLAPTRRSPQDTPMRQIARGLLKQKRKTWQQFASNTLLPLHMRWQATLLLLESPQKESLPVFLQLSRDRIERLRGAAFLGAALVQSLEGEAWFDAARATERHRDVRLALQIAEAWTLKDPDAQLYSLQRACQQVHARWLHTLILRMLSLQPTPRELPLLVCLHRYGNAKSRRGALRLLSHMPASLLITLQNYLTTPGRSHCFLFQAYGYLQRHPEVPAVLKLGAKKQKLDTLEVLCRSEHHNTIRLIH
ncbi:MAG: tetratricopeptide repeat protein [Myxococcales bacterium]|nr:tetratricopeptide repeat protein [Myxococcales bacterium]